MDRLTDVQLNDLFSFYWSDYSNWFDVDRDMAGKVLSVVAELRELRAENAALRRNNTVLLGIMDHAYGLLAKSNAYMPETNEAWRVIGEALGKLHSGDPVNSPYAADEQD